MMEFKKSSNMLNPAETEQNPETQLPIETVERQIQDQMLNNNW